MLITYTDVVTSLCLVIKHFVLDLKTSRAPRITVISYWSCFIFYFCHHEHAPASSKAVFTNCLHLQRSAVLSSPAASEQTNIHCRLEVQFNCPQPHCPWSASWMLPILWWSICEWVQCMCIVCLGLHVIHPGCYLFILDLGKVRNTVQTITYLPQKGLHNNNIYRVLKHLRKLKQLHYYITIQFNKTGPTLLF